MTKEEEAVVCAAVKALSAAIRESWARNESGVEAHMMSALALLATVDIRPRLTNAR